MNDIAPATREDLQSFTPEHETFVGIDSDGCVFDSMEIKQKACFHPLIIQHWNLGAVDELVRETASFVNLYSKGRGVNRFVALLSVFDLLAARPEVRSAGVALPDMTDLQQMVNSGAELSNEGLRRHIDRTGSDVLASLYDWSLAVNHKVADTAQGIPPFEYARKSLARIRATSDAVCVSQTPTEALIREWHENAIDGEVRLIAGQELGTKQEHLLMATEGRYAEGKVLMIGDAPGDRKAAVGAGALFYPIDPGNENESWRCFHEEAYDRFLAGTYAGTYEAERIEGFEALLPEHPPWDTV
tara:strand:- start:7075 stop:7977 length:903 start_codon:yes stop_codon:yes gene_type:complete